MAFFLRKFKLNLNLNNRIIQDYFKHKEDVVVNNKSIINVYRIRTCIIVAETLNTTIMLTRFL
jgi:hypothetical protein